MIDKLTPKILALIFIFFITLGFINQQYYKKVSLKLAVQNIIEKNIKAK